MAFFCVFSKILTESQKGICASIVFKAESKPKHEEKKFWGVFLAKNQKRAFLGVQKDIFFNSNLEFVFLCFFCKRKLHADFHKKILKFRSPGIFWIWKLCGALRSHAPKIWIWTSKIMPDVWLSSVFCPIKKINITPPYYLVGQNPQINQGVCGDGDGI